VPTWRPSYCFNVAIPICSVPSGVVLGEGSDGRASKLRSELRGEGLDHIFVFYSSVLFSLSGDLFAISSLIVALIIICNPPTINLVTLGPLGLIFVQKK
jgi:hypothetical protein